MEGPLAGVRVLEVANWLAAPAGCALLADFGADVDQGGAARRRSLSRVSAEAGRHARGQRRVRRRQPRQARHDAQPRPAGRARSGVPPRARRRRLRDEPAAAAARALRPHLRRTHRPSSRPDLRQRHRLRLRGPGPRPPRLRLRRLLGTHRHHGAPRRARCAAAAAAPRHGRPHDGDADRRLGGDGDARPAAHRQGADHRRVAAQHRPLGARERRQRRIARDGGRQGVSIDRPEPAVEQLPHEGRPLDHARDAGLGHVLAGILPRHRPRGTRTRSALRDVRQPCPEPRGADRDCSTICSRDGRSTSGRRRWTSIR